MVSPNNMDHTNKKFVKDNLLVALVSVIGISMIFAVHVVFAAPTTAPPNGNPLYSNGAVGPQGPRGSTGSKGSNGNTGNKGANGPNGTVGAARCDWNGAVYISHGHDGGCAWEVGSWWTCSGGRLTSINTYYSGSVATACGGWQYDS